MLIDRRGAIQHVMVGDASKIFLPEFGRIRGGAGRFRGLRLVHTHLRGEALTRDDLTDLALLRLDAVAAITVDAAGRPGKLFVAPHGAGCAAAVELPAEPATAPRIELRRADRARSSSSSAARTAVAVDRSRQGPRADRPRRSIGRATDMPRRASPSCASCAAPPA